MNRLSRWTAVLLVLIVFVGASTRAREHAASAGDLTLQTISGCYISMAVNLPSGLGQVNLADQQAYLANPYGFMPARTEDRTQLRNFFDGIDPGLSLIYWVAIALFGRWTSAVMALAWLQVLVDSLCIVVMFCVGRRLMKDDLGGLLAAFLYAFLHAPISLSATFPFYYYWTGAFAVLNLWLAGLLLDEEMWSWSALRRFSIAGGYGAMLGVASMTRSFFLPMGALIAALLLVRHRAHWRRVVPVVLVLLAVQGLVLAPMFARNYARFHRLTTRWMWHTAYIGFGAHPNPLGITWDDSAGLAAAKAHGFDPGDPDWEVRYDDIMRGVVRDIYRQYPGLALRNAVENIGNGLTGFDGGFVLHWRLGERPHVEQPWRTPGVVGPIVGEGQPFIAAMLALQLAAFVLFLWRRADAWLYAAALLATYAVFLVGALCPPWVLYNSAYTPSFVVFATVAWWALIRGVIGAVRAGVRAATADDARMAGAMKIVLAVLLLPGLLVPHVKVGAHVEQVALAFATLLALHALLALHFDARTARNAFVACAVGFSAGLVQWHRQDGFLSGLGPLMWPQVLCMSLVLMAFERRLIGAATTALLAVAATGLRPVGLFLPLIFLTLLGGRGRDARALCAWAFGFGAAAWGGLEVLSHLRLLDADTLALMPSHGERLWLVASPLAAALLLPLRARSREVRLLTTAVVLLVMALSRTFPAWTLVGTLLLALAVWPAPPTGDEPRSDAGKEPLSA